MDHFIVLAGGAQLFDDLLDLLELPFSFANDPVPSFDHRLSPDTRNVGHGGLIQEAYSLHGAPDALVLPAWLLHFGEFLQALFADFPDLTQCVLDALKDRLFGVV